MARGELHAERLLAINPGTATRPLDGVQTKEPAFGLPAVWVGSDQRETAAAAGYTVVDATTALSTHLSETIRTFLPDLLSRQQVKEMLDRLASRRQSWSRTWCRRWCRSATCSGCCGSCCASACRYATW